MAIMVSIGQLDKQVKPIAYDQMVLLVIEKEAMVQMMNMVDQVDLGQLENVALMELMAVM